MHAAGALAQPWLSKTLRSPVLWLALALPLGAYSVRSILSATGGRLAVPLDDAYIHFQYARALNAGHFFSYTAGAAPTPGATSLLWPLLLAPFHALGCRGDSIIIVAWLWGWCALALSAYETERLASRFLGRPAALGAGVLQLSFGANAWFATSGMETPLLAWASVRSVRRAAEWREGERISPYELLALAAICPLARPEGLLISLLVGLTLFGFGRKWKRLYGVAAGLLGFLPWLCNWIFTGSAASTTSRVKWLWFNPYLNSSEFVAATLANLQYFFDSLLDGHTHAAAFIPEGYRFLALAGLLAICVAGVLAKRTLRALLSLALGMCILLPATYDSFLWNRLRYLWPFVPVWFMGLAALAHVVTLPLRRLRFASEIGQTLLMAILVWGLASRFEIAVTDLAVSSAGILEQQVWLGKWAKQALPDSARIGVNDTGAIAYFSDRKVFDIVGLTTRGEAQYWTAGAGSRFEHYERLPRQELPTHFIVYPAWFALPMLFGECLAERNIPWATVLGGALKVACQADYTLLGSAELPFSPPGTRLLDSLDTADLASELQHHYQVLPANVWDNLVVQYDQHVDGARQNRTLDTFELALAQQGTLTARWGAAHPTKLQVLVDSVRIAEIELEATPWQEFSMPIPASVASGSHRIQVFSATGAAFTSLHYWSYR